MSTSEGGAPTPAGPPITAVVATRGSHAKLRRELADGTRQILTIPLHRELAPGTLRAVFRQATRFIPADELRPYFFR